MVYGTGGVVQFPRRRIAVWAGCLAATGGLIAADPRGGYDHPAVRLTAWVAAGHWFLAANGMLAHGRTDWRPGDAAFEAIRWNWGLGWLTLLVHVAVAFHLAHGWSHADAVRRTAETAGFGEGVFVNYAVVAVWGADAMWLAGWPKRYTRRPKWVGRGVHGLLAFVVFNATVVYATSPLRWAAAIAFVLMEWGIWRSSYSGDANDVPVSGRGLDR